MSLFAVTWVPTEQPRIVNVEPWNILVGADRLASPSTIRATASRLADEPSV
jgi:hypothetical protein